MELTEPFSLAILAVNTLMHIDSPQEQAQLFQGIFRQLVPGGLLALDLFHPHPASLAPAEGELLLEKIFLDPKMGCQVLKFVARQVDYARQTITTTFIYDEVDAQGQVRRTVLTFPMRYLYRAEAEYILQAAGFVLEGIYGSYELDPYEDTAERMIFLARRPKDAVSSKSRTSNR